MAEEGISLFRGMGMIKALSQLEVSIGHEFNDFDLVDGKSKDTVEMLTGGGKKAKEAVKKERKPKFGGHTTTKVGAFKLKLGGE